MRTEAPTYVISALGLRPHDRNCLRGQVVGCLSGGDRPEWGERGSLLQRGFGRECVLSTGRSMHKASGRARLGEPLQTKRLEPREQGAGNG